MADEHRDLTLEQWHAEASGRYGDDPNRWRFACPMCGHVQTRQDFLDMGMKGDLADQLLGFSCIGRYRTTDPEADVAECGEFDRGYGCDYVGDRGQNCSPVTILVGGPGELRPTFEFALPCTTCVDDGRLCERCEQRKVDCNCKTWNPHHRVKWKDCPDCRG